jgi:hypothetical protein
MASRAAAGGASTKRSGLPMAAPMSATCSAKLSASGPVSSYRSLRDPAG